MTSETARDRQPPLDERLEELWAEAARDGRRLPGEPALAAALSSSRPAVREALIRLEERGYIHRRKGADTTVNTSLLDIPARFDRRVEESALIRAMGQTPQLDVLDVQRTRITLDEAEAYDLRPGTEVLRVHKRWTADGVPALLAHDSVPITGAVDPETIDPEQPMVDIAVTLAGARAEWEVVWPTATALDEADAAHASRPAGEPVLTLEVSGMSPTHGVCYWTTEHHLSGAFRYAMVRRADWR
ncbi:GntR family transcriptional regulator [Aeromicrobium sp. YIM 150415]|uniref:GntR family transcriptional regulator n=1 Tax=Aeromicrobium sp. YIM 150415 TaxID=2803912 RepID=UPI00196547EF|nr:GntR family transcriptional regulator [Aeromicrobium sp. YIM 150415]MBM9463037.1 GntR family transcriptional regulator [Aeromicrobium sp. YIM 150415]